MSEALPSIQDVAAQFAKPAPLATADAPKPEQVQAAPEAHVQEAAPVQEVPPASKEEKALEQAEQTQAEQPKQDPKVAKAFSDLSKRERSIREMEQRVKESEARAQKLIQDAEAKLKAAEEKENALSGAKRPLELMAAKGWKYADVTEDFLKGGDVPVPEPDPFAEKLKPLQERLEKFADLEKRFNEREQQLQEREFNTNLQTVNTTIKNTIESNPDRYEYTLKFGAQAIDSIRETMVQYAQAPTIPGKPFLSYEEAADQVEEYWENVSNTLQTTKKLSSKFNTQSAQPAVKPAQQAPQATTTPTKPATLTQDLGTEGVDSVDINKLPRAEAIRYLAKKIKFVAD